MADLYKMPIGGSEFASFCGGNQQEENQESCVSFAAIPGGFAVRDSKPEGAGRELRFTGEELDTFAVGYARARGLI